MKTKKQIEQMLQNEKDYYVRSMNGGGKFTPKDKYSTQGKIEILQQILED